VLQLENIKEVDIETLQGILDEMQSSNIKIREQGYRKWIIIAEKLPNNIPTEITERIVEILKHYK
ncbi:MAG: hypothetical protein ACTSYN_03575, partial [Candidatus Heimdallarchaeaceae archaeon]